MKWISRVNRGAILTGAVVLGVIVYLVVISIVQRASLPEIKQICSAYIAIDVQYSMLPDAERKEAPDITDAELNDYIEQMKKDISAFYPEGEQYSEFAVKAKTSHLEKQAAGHEVIIDYSKKIISYSGFAFKDNAVTVTIITDTSIEKTGQPEKGVSGAVRSEMTDRIILNKTDKGWKVIFASIGTPESYDEYPYYYKG